MNRRKLIPFLLAVALAGSTALLLALRAPSASSSASAARSGADATRSGWGAIPTDGRDVGQKRVYEVALETTFDSKGGGKPAQTFGLTGDFRLSVTAFASDDHRTSVRAEIAPARVRQNRNGAAVDTTAETQRALAEPIALSIAHSGMIERVYMDAKIDPLLHGVARAVLSALQFVAPADRRAESWSATEEDSTGKFVAGYRRTGELEFAKTRDRYLDDISSNMGFHRRERKGPTQLTLLRSGILEHVDSAYEEAIVSDSAEMRARTRVRLRLVSVEQTDAEPVAMSRANAGSLTQSPAATRRPAEHYAELAKGQSVAGLSRVLVETDPDDTHGRMAVMYKLDALFRTQGDAAVAEAAQAVRSTESDDDARVIMGALEAAHTPAAQRALTELAADATVPSDRRITSLMHLGLAEAPTSETLGSLRTMADNPELDDELRSTALLALGGSLRNADPSLPQDEGAPSVDYLLERASAASSEEERRLALDALGNSGHGQALDTIDDALGDAEPGMRATAASALRHIDDAKADGMIADTALADDDASVRAQALSALRYRSLTKETETALLDALSHDEDVAVRLTALEVAAHHMQEHAQLGKALAHASEHDAEAAVRARAAALIEGT